LRSQHPSDLQNSLKQPNQVRVTFQKENFEMQTSRKLTHALVALFALVMMSVAALAADPGSAYPATSEISDQKAGSILVYNYYSSPSTPTPNHNTRINITNTSSTSAVIVHLFFVAENCSIADFKLPMSANYTYTFNVSEFDPNINGYLVAVASDGDTGLPRSHNFLIGDEYIKLPGGASANLGAEAIAATYEGVLDQSADNFGAILRFGVTADARYNRLPAVLAVDNFPSRADQNETTIILNNISGSLAETMNSVPRLFALVYDDQEVAYSTSFLAGSCQKRVTLSDAEPRTAPRLSSIVPAGRSGWIRIYSSTGNVPLLGSMINFNPNTNSRGDVFNGGHNLHKLALTTGTISVTVPVFPF
jgi:hypothetical protein